MRCAAPCDLRPPVLLIIVCRQRTRNPFLSTGPSARKRSDGGDKPRRSSANLASLLPRQAFQRRLSARRHQRPGRPVRERPQHFPGLGRADEIQDFDGAIGTQAFALENRAGQCSAQSFQTLLGCEAFQTMIVQSCESLSGRPVFHYEARHLAEITEIPTQEDRIRNQNNRRNAKIHGLEAGATWL
jgi:hypothetical protein